MENLIQSLDIGAIYDSVAQGHYAMATALMLWLLVRILKDPRLNMLSRLDAKYRPLIVVALGAAAGCADSIVNGVPIAKAVVMGLVAAAMAIAGQEVVVNSLMGGKEPMAPKEKQ